MSKSKRYLCWLRHRLLNVFVRNGLKPFLTEPLSRRRDIIFDLEME
jgi:hypothetical protein